MKLVLACALVLAAAPVMAAPPRCDNDHLMRSLARLMGGPNVQVVREKDQVALELTRAGAKETLVRATCDAVALPFAEQLERPSKDHTTRVIEGITLAKTARGAISLDIPAGMADRAALQLLVLDDQSLSLTRGDKVFYAFATLPDGTTVETEGIGNGCGCEKTTDPSGKVTRKALPR